MRDQPITILTAEDRNNLTEALKKYYQIAIEETYLPNQITNQLSEYVANPENPKMEDLMQQIENILKKIDIKENRKKIVKEIAVANELELIAQYDDIIKEDEEKQPQIIADILNIELIGENSEIGENNKSKKIGNRSNTISDLSDLNEKKIQSGRGPLINIFNIMCYICDLLLNENLSIDGGEELSLQSDTEKKLPAPPKSSFKDNTTFPPQLSLSSKVPQTLPPRSSSLLMREQTSEVAAPSETEAAPPSGTEEDHPNIIIASLKRHPSNVIPGMTTNDSTPLSPSSPNSPFLIVRGGGEVKVGGGNRTTKTPDTTITDTGNDNIRTSTATTNAETPETIIRNSNIKPGNKCYPCAIL